MTFDLSGIPEELQDFIKEALEMRKAALLFTEKEIKTAMQESINEIKKHIGSGTFKGLNKELLDIMEEEKIFFAAELDRIMEQGLTKASYAGLSIGSGILRHYKAKGILKFRIIEKDIMREAELIAKSTMEKKRVFKNKEFVLSERIWDLSGNNYDKIKEIISSGINTDCVKVAKALTQYVKEGSATLAKDYPAMYNRMAGRVPKNLNYEALRLARNELSEVYWQSTIEGYKDNPAIKAIKWLLSNNRIPGFHDICDELAYADNFGLGAGIYPLDDAPERPHICCLCNLAPIIADDIKKGDAANKPPENWEEIKERLKKTNSFINMNELTEEQKETLREQRREAYRRQKEKKEAEKAQKIDENPIEYKSADEKIEKELQIRAKETWEKELLGSEQNAIREYSGADYGITNRYLRNALEEYDDIQFNQTEQKIKELDRALSKSNLGDNLMLYRGVDYSEFEFWKKNTIINTYKSTSIRENIDDVFGDGYKIKIYAPKTTKGLYIGNYSEIKSEKEFLMHRNQKYKILKILNNTLEVEFYD